MRIRLAAITVIALLAAGCGTDTGAPSATAAGSATAPTAASASSTTSVGGVTLQASTMAVADLNEEVAARYGIDRAQEGVLLLVTVRNPAGDGIDPGDLQLSATAGALPDAPAPLPLRAIVNGDMTDYIGVLQAKAPASVQFKLTATRGGARADISTTAELQPR